MQTKTMTLSLLAAMAALSGCAHNNQGRCVDQNGNLLPSTYCQSGGGGGGYYGGQTYIYPRRVYGGSVSGGRVSGYSASPSEEGRGGIFRGGFGSHGGFGGGE